MVLTNPRNSERDSTRLDLGLEHLSGLLVSTLSFVIFIDHAHPLMIVGHPFKGGLPMSTGYLAHPDMKRFGLDDSTLFTPPRPNAFMNAISMGAMATAAT